MNNVVAAAQQSRWKNQGNCSTGGNAGTALQSADALNLLPFNGAKNNVILRIFVPSEIEKEMDRHGFLWHLEHVHLIQRSGISDKTRRQQQGNRRIIAGR